MRNLNFKLHKFSIKHFDLKSIALLLFYFAIIPSITAITDPNLKAQYSFNSKVNTDSIVDETGNGYTAKLVGGAKIKKLGTFSLLEIGADAGYVDMGAKMGEVVSTLTDFSISTYLYVDPTATLTSAGNFVWTFSNAANIATSATGCMFYTAKDSRYAISTTNYNAEKGFSAEILLDKEGKQIYKFKAGSHSIAVKVIDNEGLENIEIVKLKINGIVQETDKQL